MEDFTLPSVGAMFKKWECCTPILPKCHIHPHNTNKKKVNKNPNIAKKKGVAEKACSLADYGPRSVGNRWSSPNSGPSTSGHPPVVRGCPKLLAAKKILLPPAHIFLHMWSTWFNK
jgi:hypothetical protein